MFEISFERQNVRIAPSRWLFAKRHACRFDWMALLAYRRAKPSLDIGWVTLNDIVNLPNWAGMTRRHAGINIGRYLQAYEREGLELVEAQSRWVGPYRLNVLPSNIQFDIPIAQIEKRLKIKRKEVELPREELRRFVFRYARAQWLFNQGELVPIGTQADQGAFGEFLHLTNDDGFCPRLQLIACIAALRVLFRLGRFGAAGKTLAQNAKLVRSVNDPVLKAQYFLAVAWSRQRSESGTSSNRSIENALSSARAFAEDSGDRASLGLLAYRTGGFLTKKGRHEEAILQLLYAVEAAIVTGNFDAVQSYCAEVGSVIHRLGPDHYPEARAWLLLGIAISRWMRIGREDAHGEMILGKTYAELGKQPNLARFWLQRAERIAQRSGNQLNSADVKMVWAFWHQRFGTRRALVETLCQALLMFRNLRDFDGRQKERYMGRKFPSVWPDVTKFAEAARQR
jgi:tetratricopeptide (TPR) repeat protein